MLLESITLENFRQFRHESIDFAQGDNGKNVTIIIGENGTGKNNLRPSILFGVCMERQSFPIRICLTNLSQRR